MADKKHKSNRKSTNYLAGEVRKKTLSGRFRTLAADHHRSVPGQEGFENPIEFLEGMF
jgi:hypothetical protein